LLGKLMDLVGELVLTRNQILQFAGKLQEPTLLNATQRLNLITTKLQANVMKTRMQPISNIWSKFPRIVRDLSRELDKKISLVMEGRETELDRTIIEAVKDPLTHLVRNAIDHGLERPAERVAAGKPEEGVLRLRAFHESGHVNIEIRDDGSGIRREKVLEKAIQKGLIHPDRAARLSDREVFALLFAPGFSTAERVTNISGRGVGLDVVKKNVEKIGGTVDVQSVAGRSTTFRVKIPLTLAIVPALIIQCDESRYAIPQSSLVELVRIESENVAKSIEYIDSAPVYRLRGNLLPLVSLREQLRLPKAAAGDEESILLLVVQAEGRQFGLIVDGIHDTEEIVVKPLGKELNGLSAYAGATIMGDGRVALILDVLGLARGAHVLDSSTREPEAGALAGDRRSAERGAGERQSVLLFSIGAGQPAAIPLSHVARLEEFDTASIEQAASSEVVQYRGQIMPLVRVGAVLQRAVSQDEEKIHVVVYNHRGVNIGLVVDRILDTVDEVFSVQRCVDRPGILGSAVVQKRVTDFLDADALIRASSVIEFTGAA
jgi:two-component system, chemotaxis family, sensor kinase CheA